ncbi:phage baseplate assembly protein V [Roseomonas rosulenta]|uniref:phage baseplate assembly protein V n=1 Tax=Roseomonas rosulenta TaxID=2748667 RepID=UPI0018DEF83C|nr:phage baseplate assembly protein V [Roseomonas rosulenta]
MAIINGVVRGIITDGADPTRGGRVYVQMPALAGSGGVWAPVCRAFGASGGGGGSVGGAVWVAFENGDPAYPVVLGLAD